MKNITYPDSPIDLFNVWFQDAAREEINDPNAMALASVDSSGHPSVRIVLLKGFNDDHFVFFTNYESRKGGEILNNAAVALCFHWKSLKRQVRVEGVAIPVSDAEADSYFASRPTGSQIGAWASQQSRPLENRDVLEQRLAYYSIKFGDEPIPRPAYWSGFRVNPDRIEFWQEQPFRLHDRIQYDKIDGNWMHTRLYP